MRKLRLREGGGTCSGYTVVKWPLVHSRLPLHAGDSVDGCGGRRQLRGEDPPWGTQHIPSAVPAQPPGCRKLAPDSPSYLPDPGTSGLGLLFLFLSLLPGSGKGVCLPGTENVQVGVVDASLFIVMKYVPELMAFS